MKKIDWQSSTAHSQAGIQIQRLKDQIKKLTQKANGYQLKMNSMIQELNALRTEKSSWKQHTFQQTILDQEQNDDKIDLLRKDILRNMLENEKKSSYKRKYSEETLSFSKILRDTSPKCYNILRQVLKFPSAQTIEKYFGNEHQFFKSVLINYQLIPAIMEKYKEVFHISQELNAVLSVDAAGLDRPDNGNTYVFVFYLQPLNYEYKCIPLYLFPKSNGSANEEIIQIIYQIVEILKSCSINILAVATDGDPGYNQEAKKTFEIFNVVIESGIDEVIKKIKNNNQLLFILYLK